MKELPGKNYDKKGRRVIYPRLTLDQIGKKRKKKKEVELDETQRQWRKVEHFVNLNKDNFGKGTLFFTFRKEAYGEHPKNYHIYAPFLPLDFKIYERTPGELVVNLFGTKYIIESWKDEKGVKANTMKLIMLILRKHAPKKDYRLKTAEERAIKALRFEIEL